MKPPSAKAFRDPVGDELKREDVTVQDRSCKGSRSSTPVSGASTPIDGTSGHGAGSRVRVFARSTCSVQRNYN